MEKQKNEKMNVKKSNRTKIRTTSSGLKISKSNKLVRAGFFFKLFSSVRDFLD